jgi:hypothetical protein
MSGHLYWHTWQIHSSLYLCDPNFWIGMKGYYASIIPNSFLIRKTMGSGPGHSGWKWLPFTMIPNTSGTWKWGSKCAYLHGHRQSLDRSTPKGADDMTQAVEWRFTGIKPWVQIQYSQRQKKIWGWGSSLVKKCLPSMYKALGSIPQHY